MLDDIIVYDGLDEMDALGPLEVLRKAQALRDDVEIRLVSPTGQKMVRGAGGLVFSTDGAFDPAGVEIVVVPGGGWVARAPVGAWGEHLRGELVTCGGVTSGIDLALWLVERELGAELAEQISQVIEYRWFRPCPAPLEGEPSLFVMPVELFEREP
jgi:transcriptional regulator GlxA family with amidase domain